MILENHVRNDFGKTDTPDNTIRMIEAGFDRLGYDIVYMPFQVAEHIHWSQIGIDAIHLQCQGKGLTPQLAMASAHAELAERFSAGLFYGHFEEQVRFNLPALYGRQTNRFLNYEWLDGYIESHQDGCRTTMYPSNRCCATSPILRRSRSKPSRTARWPGTGWTDTPCCATRPSRCRSISRPTSTPPTAWLPETPWRRP